MALDLARLFADSPSLVVLLRLDDGRIVDANKRFEQVTGYPLAQARGKTPKELGLWDDPRSQRAMFERMSAERSVVNQPFRFRIHDPSFLHLQAFTLLMPGRLLADWMAINASLDPIMGGVDK